MATIFLEPNSNRYHIRFRFGGVPYKRSLRTADKKQANAALVRLEETVSLVERGVFTIPPGTDTTAFLLSGGKLQSKAQARHISLGALFTMYQKSLPKNAKDESTIKTEQTHLKHFRKYIPLSKPATSIASHDIQKYVNKRLKQKFAGKLICADTVKREMNTLRAIFSWAKKQQLLEGGFPTTGLVFPKRDEKPPFKTREEIERIVSRGGLNELQFKEIWNCLYLTIPEIHEILNYLKKNPRYPFIYPMIAFVAYTGCRRSEMLRSTIDDINLKDGTVQVREKKRSRKRSTTFRQVQMPSSLSQILTKWLQNHPGGQFTFCQDFGKSNGKWMNGLTKDQARTQFKKAFRNSKWEVIRGFHVFRHSYASNLAAAGVDQRIIDKHMGHQTEEMRKRYQHLRPDVCKDAVEVLAL